MIAYVTSTSVVYVSASQDVNIGTLRFWSTRREASSKTLVSLRSS